MDMSLEHVDKNRVYQRSYGVILPSCFKSLNFFEVQHKGFRKRHKIYPWSKKRSTRMLEFRITIEYITIE